MARLSGEFNGKITRIKSAVGDAPSDAVSVETTVRTIVADVRDQGDAAVHGYAKAFDRSELDDFEVSGADREEALARLDPQTRRDTEFAIERVRAFAEAQLATILPLEVEALPGLHLGHRVIPIETDRRLCPGWPLSPSVGTGHDDCSGQGRGMRGGHCLPAA